MIAEDFWEVGASGRTYERAFVLDMLEERHKTPQHENLRAVDFRIRALSAGTYLLHYTLFQDVRKTRRTTMWKKIDEDWKIVFHPGTIVQ